MDSAVGTDQSSLAEIFVGAAQLTAGQPVANIQLEAGGRSRRRLNRDYGVECLAWLDSDARIGIVDEVVGGFEHAATNDLFETGLSATRGRAGRASVWSELLPIRE